MSEEKQKFEHEKPENEHKYKKHPRISLRDYFAAAAMQGCIAGNDVLKPDDLCKGRKTVSLEKLSAWAYEMSDAMLEARAA